MKVVELYTDGACSGNPGPGGWAALLIYQGNTKEISGGEGETTNNRMELKAAIEGLKGLKFPCAVNLYTDSSYLCNAFNRGWLLKWLDNEWKTSNKSSVENRDLWEQLIELTKVHKVCFIKVKSHGDNAHNNRCDELARAAIKALPKEGK
ncbi:MAG: Ribonuclease H [Firmicutes bacterium ADurb.Bin182]|nr:MAG: Ribonuclease H [Firmicutes bacterium ADurb.Bin182]